MGATLRALSGLIRIGPDHAEIGDPWGRCVNVHPHHERPWVAVVVGATDGVPAHRCEIREALRRAGFRGWGWTRIKGGKPVFR